MHKSFVARMDCSLGAKENHTGLQLGSAGESDAPIATRCGSSESMRAPRFLVSTSEMTPGLVIKKKAKAADALYVDSEVITETGVKLKIRDISKRPRLAVGNNKAVLKP